MLEKEKGLLGQRVGILAEICSALLKSPKTGALPATLSRRLHNFSTPPTERNSTANAMTYRAASVS